MESADSKLSIHITFVFVSRRGDILLWFEYNQRLCCIELGLELGRRSSELHVFPSPCIRAAKRETMDTIMIASCVKKKS